MAEEGSTQVRVSTDAAQAASHAPRQALQILRGRVGQGGGVQMSPELFDGIQFGGISGEWLQAQPVAMVAEGLTGEPAAMSRQPIPEQDHRATSVTLKVVQEAHDVPAANPSLMQRQQPARAPAVGAGQHRPDPRHALPVKRLDQARRLPARCPGGPDGRTLREAAFVHKTQPSLQPLGGFFTWGQRRRTPPTMASSLRSLARRAGRWRLQSNCCRTRHVCDREYRT